MVTLEVTQADRDAAADWELILNHRYSEYDGDPVAEHDRIFAERHTPQRPSWLDRWRR